MKKIYNLRTFLTIYLLSACAVSALQAKHDLSVASCNVMYEKYFQMAAKNNIGTKNIISLDNRTKLFEKSLTDGPLSKADVIVFQEWPDYNNSDKQSKAWNKILKKTGRFVCVSNNLKKNSRDGVAIAVKTSNNYKIDSYYYEREISNDTRYYIGTKEKKRGDVLAVVLKFKKTNKKVIIVNCHLQGGMPDDNDSEFNRFYEKALLENKYHLFRRYQIKKILSFIEYIEDREQTSSVIVMGDFNWNFDESRSQYKNLLRRPLFPRGKWTDADPRARNEEPNITTCRIKPDKKYFKNEYTRLDYMFFKGKITQKKKYLKEHQPTSNSMFSKLALLGKNLFYNNNNKNKPKQKAWHKKSYTLYPLNRHNLLSPAIKTSIPSSYGGSWHFSDHAIVTSEFILN